MPDNVIQYLQFDSNLFGYPVGKAQLDQDWDEMELLQMMEVYQMVYLYSDHSIDFTSSQILLQDRRLTFIKTLDSLIRPSSIEKYQGELSSELVELALLSGSFSRFKSDCRLVNQEFQKLYQLWISKAFERNQILVSANLEGMASYSAEDEMASLELIAVADAHQKKGWGRQLVEAVEFQAKSEGALQMQISTQEQNVAACRLYQAMGYQPIDRKFIYHYWRG